MNSIDDSGEMTSVERFLAIALILALGYLRLKRLDSVMFCIDSSKVDKSDQIELLLPSESLGNSGNTEDGLDLSNGLVHCSNRVNTTKK
jgi:hypothetical protein